MPKDKSNGSSEKPKAVNKSLLRVQKESPKQTRNMSTEELAEAKRHKYGIQNAALEIGTELYEQAKARGEEYTPNMGELRRLAKERADAGLSKGGKVDFQSDQNVSSASASNVGLTESVDSIAAAMKNVGVSEVEADENKGVDVNATASQVERLEQREEQKKSQDQQHVPKL